MANVLTFFSRKIFVCIGHANYKHVSSRCFGAGTAFQFFFALPERVPFSFTKVIIFKLENLKELQKGKKLLESASGIDKMELFSIMTNNSKIRSNTPKSVFKLCY